MPRNRLIFTPRPWGRRAFTESSVEPQGVHAALIMDLVGHDVELQLPGLNVPDGSLGNLLFVTGAESHASLPEVLQSCLPLEDLPVVASLNRNIGDMSDHHVFRLHGVPYFFLSCGHWPHYHCETDTPDRLNYAKMERICGLLVQLCRKLAATELDVSRHPMTPESLAEGVIDTTKLEIELLEAAFGDALPVLLRVIGLTSLASRQDLDQLAARFQGLFAV